MNITTIDMLDAMVSALSAAVSAATVSREYRDMDELSVDGGDFPRVMVLLGGGDQRETLYPTLDEDTEVVLVLYVYDEDDSEAALIDLFGQVLSGIRSGFDAGGNHYDVNAVGRYTTSRQSVKPYAWLTKRVTVFQRFG